MSPLVLQTILRGFHEILEVLDRLGWVTGVIFFGVIGIAVEIVRALFRYMTGQNREVPEFLSPDGGPLLPADTFLSQLRNTKRKMEEAMPAAATEERNVLRFQIAFVQSHIADPEPALQQINKGANYIMSLLADFGDDVSKEQLEEARDSFIEGDYGKADKVLADLEASGRYDVTSQSCISFARGLIAENQFQSDAAAAHFARSATLKPDPHALTRASEWALIIGQQDQALDYAQDLLALERHAGSELDIWSALTTIFAALRATERYSEAEEVVREALVIARAMSEAAPDEIVVSLAGLASLLEDMDRDSEAEPIWSEAVEITRGRLPNGAADHVSILSAMASSLWRMNRKEEAEVYYREALKVGSEMLGPMDPSYTTHLSNLGQLLSEKGQLQEAESLLRDAVETDRLLLGALHPDYPVHLFALAKVVERSGALVKAEELYREALEIERQVAAVPSPDGGIRLDSFASFLGKTGRYEEAEELSREAVKVLGEAVGTNHPKYAQSLNTLGTLLIATERDAEAEPLFWEALRVLDAVLGSGHPHTISVSDNLKACQTAGKAN